MNPGPGWYPVKLDAPAAGAAKVQWQDLRAVNGFTEPFFEDTLHRARTRDGKAEVCWTPLSSLQDADFPHSTRPTAFLFHASRCGSTLLTQLLCRLEGCLALSEPAVLDEVLQLPLTNDLKASLLRQLVRALGQPRPEPDQQFIIKFDSWHLPWFPLIRQTFPDTPCYFVYRDPVGILWSHHRQRGSQMVPGLRNREGFSIDSCDLSPGDLDAYAARVLESIFLQAVPMVESGRLIPLVHHQLVADPLSGLDRMGFSLTDREKTRLRERSYYHSKQTAEAWQPEKERNPPEALRQRFLELTAPALAPAYEALESRRQVIEGGKCTVHHADR